MSLHTIADFIRFAYTRMNEAEVSFGHGFDNAWDESVYLVLSSLYLPWDFDQSLWSCRLEKDERKRLHHRIDERVKRRIPSAYLVRQAWFAGAPYYVDERVLVPRSPIGELINKQYSPWLPHEPDQIMDLCTGSGCIGISSALAFEDAQVALVDISSDALDVANTNIMKHEVGDRVSAYKSDVFDGLGLEHQGRYDLIVSNPPYVDARDLDEMPQEFGHEPVLGLAAGPDGLDIVVRILRQAKDFLNSEGVLIVELGNSWVALEQRYPDFPFTWIEFEHGGHGVFVMTAQELKSREW